MIIKYLIPFISFGILIVSAMDIVNPGPKYPPTKGEVWPKPQLENKKNTYYAFVPTYFNVTVTNLNCNLLSTAIKRYLYIIKQKHGQRSRDRRIRTIENNGNVYMVERNDELYQGLLTELQVELTAPCENYPSFGMDERYTLNVLNVSRLESNSIWGILRGLETFVQLLYLDIKSNEIRINATEITDFPSYSHRGLLLDTSRHYITVDNILKTLEAMAINKMNVFHWHIVDDQSFPYQSEKFPELSKKGAYYDSMIYTKEDIQRIVKYARNRGIRVIPEFDIPGHTRSWGVAYPNILTKCYQGTNVIGLGPLNPLSNDALNLIKDLFGEVQEWFPDKFFHVGGDEVQLDCWESNPELQEYMEHNNLTASGLHALFMRNAMPLLRNDTNAIVWQEVFDENVPLRKETIVQVWKYQPTAEMINILSTGHRVIFSANWYLSDLKSEWTQYYKFDPRQMVYNVLANETVLSNIVGGEACMWGEMVDDRNVISRVWPRASAVAEKLWTSGSIHDDRFSRSRSIPDEVYNRIEEHTCRMIHRGIDAQPPTGPGFCIV